MVAAGPVRTGEGALAGELRAHQLFTTPLSAASILS